MCCSVDRRPDAKPEAWGESPLRHYVPQLRVMLDAEALHDEAVDVVPCSLREEAADLLRTPTGERAAQGRVVSVEQFAHRERVAADRARDGGQDERERG